MKKTAAKGEVIEGTGAVRRSWRWSPYNRLTACCARDAFLFAATEEGDVVVWDLRRRGPRASADDAWRGNLTEIVQNGVKVAITGIYAPHAMAFLTCALDGSVVYWTRQAEDEAWEGILANPQSPNGENIDNEAEVVRRGCASGCVAMAGDGNLAAVVRELGELEVYWCP
ncbi:unnamed protein product [Phytomonas sp. Hart1]|nr:unnamed protein product [Phytomonas sp. Hart1]|eukprot:CCW71807.1 unnamed protein product [Phytomonas sp. isolate Hart1]